jgi:4-oxalocrotonate tautomerase
MPLVQIHLMKGKPTKYLKKLRGGIQEALCTAWKIPETDQFQIISEHKKSHFSINKTIWGVKRSNDVIVLSIRSIQRSAALKKKLYAELARVLEEKIGLRPEDLFVSIVGIGKDDWSFGNGIAQFLEPGQKP